MRANSSHSKADRGLDAYWTPPAATRALVWLEQLPPRLWEPACGAGHMVQELRSFGYSVAASDVADYGFSCDEIDFLKDPISLLRLHDDCGIVTNPPYGKALEFASEAILRAPYVALLMQLGFLGGLERKTCIFDAAPPTRVWISSRRLPMMHRNGWSGPKSSTNLNHAWFVWDRRTRFAASANGLLWFDWQELERNHRVRYTSIRQSRAQKKAGSMC